MLPVLAYQSLQYLQLFHSSLVVLALSKEKFDCDKRRQPSVYVAFIIDLLWLFSECPK